MARILLSIPFPLSWRNLMPTGMAARLLDGGKHTVLVASPYEQPEFTDTLGNVFPNITVPGRLPYAVGTVGSDRPKKGVASGMPTPNAVNKLDKLLKLIHQTGFALEFPNGSIDLQRLNRERHPARWPARLLTTLAPRRSTIRRALRSAYSSFRPRRREIRQLFDKACPACVVVTSPGHYWLDFLLMDEAARRGIPTVCIVQSWDNLYSRGPMHRRPDRLLVWSPEMRRQAIEVHQYPADQIDIVGPLQFSLYAEPPTQVEMKASRARVSLGPEDPFLYYVCGARTATYDVEDIVELQMRLKGTEFGSLSLVVRPHPQGSRQAYERLKALGILLDASPDITQDTSRPDAFNPLEVRHVASLLAQARFVVSSWGTTVLLEACIFDAPALQLRWYDSLAHSQPDETAMVRDFQSYYHMQAFDQIASRAFSDRPDDVVGQLRDLCQRDADYREQRRRALNLLTCPPLSGAVNRCVESTLSLL